MKKLTPEFVKAVADYLLVETPLAKADVCLVFGNPHADHLAAQAADLYHQGYFERIVVSGGAKTDDGRTEACRMRDVLVERGVPEDCVLVENKSHNSGENVVNSMALLDKEIGLPNIKSVLAIGHIQASRRFLMTLERHWPDVIKMFTTENCYGAAKEAWDTDPKFRKKVLSEFNKVAPYKARGLIREVDMGDLCKRIATLSKPRPPEA